MVMKISYKVQCKIFLLCAIIVLLLAGCAQKQPAQKTTSAKPSAAGITGAVVQADEDVPKVACYKDDDCGKVIEKTPYCFQGSVLTPLNIPKCHFPGTVNSYCRYENSDRITLCERGVQSCIGGKCLVIATLPCKDTDSGKNYDVAGNVTDGLSILYVDDCEDKRFLLERYCSNGNKGTGMTEEYMCHDECSNGACIEEGEDEDDLEEEQT